MVKDKVFFFCFSSSALMTNSDKSSKKVFKYAQNHCCKREVSHYKYIVIGRQNEENNS